MKRIFAVGVLCIASAFVPWNASATFAPSAGEIDIAGAEKTGSHEIAVWGTISCGVASPIQLDVALQQESTGGMGMGADNSHICLRAGDNIKWIVTATGPGPWMIGDKVTITAIAVFLPDSPDPPVATDVEDHVLRLGH